MRKFIFTFGGNHKLEGKCQPIYAKDYSEAREAMVEVHGLNWAFQYTGEEWEKLKNDKERFWPMEEELESMYANETLVGGCKQIK